MLDPYGNPMAAETGTELRRYEGHDGAVYHIALSRDGRSMLSGGRDATVRLWETRGSIPNFTISPGHPGPVFVAAFSANGSKVFTASTGGFRSWDVERGTLLRQTLMATQHFTAQAEVLPGGNQLAILNPAGQVDFWDADSAGLPRIVGLKPSGGPYLAAAFSRDGKGLITGDSLGKIAAWDMQSGKELAAPNARQNCRGLGHRAQWPRFLGSELANERPGPGVRRGNRPLESNDTQADGFLRGSSRPGDGAGYLSEWSKFSFK